MRQLQKSNPVVVTVVFGIMAVFGLFFVIMAARQYTQFGNLQAHGRQAQATIDDVYDEPEGGGRYAKYSFTVGSLYFQGRDDYKGNYGDRGPITVTYLPSNPNVSAINAEARRKNGLFGLLFSILWLSLLAGMFSLGMCAAKRPIRVRLL